MIENKVFCMMPWIHMHVWPAGTVYPCCMADPELPIGDLNNNSIYQIWNSNSMKNLRKNILANKRSPECKRCYELEENNIHTLRLSSNENFKHRLEKIHSTKEDGSVEKFNMYYMDIRVSNLCNLKCRSCGPQLSSSWYEDHISLHGDIQQQKILKVNKNFVKDLYPLLLDVERVYWAGGEPLITEEHYDILDFWIDNNKTNIKLDYTTNFTQMRYKKKTIFEYWNFFKSVRVAASLDANYKKGEFLRKNISWSQIVQNRKDMIKECPDVYFEITPTVSVYNVFNLPDFHKEWIEAGLLRPENWRINILLDPVYMRLQILPIELKKSVTKKYENHIKYLEQFPNTKNVIAGYNSILSFMSVGREKEIHRFKIKTKLLDELRNENFRDVFPELTEIAYE
jgi:radical SAM protein with 4Fe4S-binding SPASM domain